MKYLIRRTGFQTMDREEAIRKITQIYLDYYELDGRSRERIEGIYKSMVEQEISGMIMVGFVRLGGIQLDLYK